MKAKAAADAANAAAELAVESARATGGAQFEVASLEGLSRAFRDQRPETRTKVTEPGSRTREGPVCQFFRRADLAAQTAERDLIVLDPRQTETARAAAESEARACTRRGGKDQA